nr:retrovirus-related Pol polyprotein from transposon TNT 1-94 [Tanacetum cinerariifolium]
MKGIKREFSLPRTPQQNGIAERKNRTLIEAAKTMLADLLLPIPFWAKAVNTTCYVQNRVLVTKPHNKTPYELLHGRSPSIGFMRPFGYLVTILNTLDSLGKFKGKIDEGFLVGYSVNSKAFRVFNSRTRIVQETLHVNFLENKPNITGSSLTWLFDIDSLTRNMNYQPVTAGNQTNPDAGFQDKFDAEKAGEEINQQYVLFPVWSSGSTNPQNYDGDAGFDGKDHDFDAKKLDSEVILSPSNRYRDLSAEFKDCSKNSSNEVNAAVTIVLIVGKNSSNSTNPFSVAELEDMTYSDDENDVGAEADFKILETSITIYVDDITFGATNKDLCKSFEKLMKDKFQMSSIGELTFFLGLQVKQKKDGIFISQDKYVAEILRKFGLTEGKSASTPIDTKKPLLKDPDCKDDSPFDLVAYSNSDYAGASLDRKSTTRGCQFLGCKLISWQCKKQIVDATLSIEAEYVAAASCCTQVLWIQNQLLDYGIKLDITSNSSDSPLLGVNTPRSDEDRLELMELTVFLLPKIE